MPNICGHSYLVHPSKHEDEQPGIGGVRIPTAGKLFDMLSALYDGASKECDVEIQFRPDGNGRQVNDSRTQMLDYLSSPSLESGQRIAAHLQSVTTRRSGLGLLFIVSCAEGSRTKLMIARFPADQGVIAQEHTRGLNLEFIERVFMKNSKTYKNVLYSCSSIRAGFWHGFAVDRQIGEARELSNYWITEFLRSELRTTSAAGTKRMAVALRTAIRNSTPDVREELLAATRVIRGQRQRRSSMASIAARLQLSDEAIEALKHALPRPELLDEVFDFDRTEFDNNIAYRSVELDNGAVLIADNSQFDRIFETEQVAGHGTRHRYSTTGSIVDERLRKTK